ncbi:hypothetical protein Pgy4_40552, partial [Pseudomonas savastanoi pv. glycinea str. race 4]
QESPHEAGFLLNDRLQLILLKKSEFQAGRRRRWPSFQ